MNRLSHKNWSKSFKVEVEYSLSHFFRHFWDQPLFPLISLIFIIPFPCFLFTLNQVFSILNNKYSQRLQNKIVDD
jgi:hypothetical protein